MYLKRILIAVIGLFVFQYAQAGVDRTEMLQDMAAFDRAYVAALALTSDQKQEPSRKSMARLNTAWLTFRKRYQVSLGTDHKWRAGFAKIDEQIRRADTIVTRATGLIEAHEALEEVRVIFMQLRRHDAIPYFPDALTAYHEPMEAIVLAAKGKTPQTLSDADLATIVRTLPEAKKLWQEAIKIPVADDVFGFDPSRSQAVNAAIQQESEALQKLEKALATRDRALLIPAAVGIKPPFARLYKQFGDFSGLE